MRQRWKRANLRSVWYRNTRRRMAFAARVFGLFLSAVALPSDFSLLSLSLSLLWISSSLMSSSLDLSCPSSDWSVATSSRAHHTQERERKISKREMNFSGLYLVFTFFVVTCVLYCTMKWTCVTKGKQIFLPFSLSLYVRKRLKRWKKRNFSLVSKRARKKANAPFSLTCFHSLRSSLVLFFLVKLYLYFVIWCSFVSLLIQSFYHKLKISSVCNVYTLHTYFVRYVHTLTITRTTFSVKYQAIKRVHF